MDRRKNTFLFALVIAVTPSAIFSQEHNDQQATNSRQAAWKFAITDDSRASGPVTSNGVSTLALGTIASDIVKQGVDFVLFPGDMVTGETNDAAALSSMLDTWVATMAPVYNAGIPVYVTRGNHEYNPGANGAANPLDPSRKTYLDHFSYLPQNGPAGEKGLTWSLYHKNAKIIGFDQYANRTSSYNNTLYAPDSNERQAMNAWVVSEVYNSRARLNFVIAHEMMWPSVSHSDCLANDPESRDDLVHALAVSNGAYFAGHDHMYVRGYMTSGHGDKVPAFVIGTAGGGNYNYGVYDISYSYKGPDAFTVQRQFSNSASPTFGYLLVTVYTDNTWSAEFHGFKFDCWSGCTATVNAGPISVLDSFTCTDGACSCNNAAVCVK